MKFDKRKIKFTDEEFKEIFSLYTCSTHYEIHQTYDENSQQYFKKINLSDEYELTQEKDFSDDTAKKIDEEVHRIICQAEKLATETLVNHHSQLRLLTEALLKHETLDKNSIDELLANPEAQTQDPDKKPTKAAGLLPC